MMMPLVPVMPMWFADNLDSQAHISAGIGNEGGEGGSVERGREGRERGSVEG